MSITFTHTSSRINEAPTVTLIAWASTAAKLLSNIHPRAFSLKTRPRAASHSVLEARMRARDKQHHRRGPARDKQQ
jgi:hypothetical protein